MLLFLFLDGYLSLHHLTDLIVDIGHLLVSPLQLLRESGYHLSEVYVWLLLLSLLYLSHDLIPELLQLLLILFSLSQ